MENASKALLIAGGVLLAIIIISLMVSMFNSTGQLSQAFTKTKVQEDITIFNSNFIKYLDKPLTIHEVVSICKFAESNGVDCSSTPYNDVSKIESDVSEIHAFYADPANAGKTIEIYYSISIVDYKEGKISKINFVRTRSIT